MRTASLFAASVVSALALVACGGDDKASTPTEPAQTTPDSVKTAVFERSYSECSTTSLQRLASKYHSEVTWAAVSRAVARAWVKRYKGGTDAEASGQDGCLQALRSS